MDLNSNGNVNNNNNNNSNNNSNVEKEEDVGKTAEKRKRRNSWMPRWKPTSAEELENAEQEMLKVSGVAFKQMQVETAPGQFVNTLICGTGPPLVLLHGFGAGIGFWTGNLAPFSKLHTVYAVDLLGFGRSSRSSFKGSSVEDAENYFVENLEKWRTAIDIKGPFSLLGHSFGGYLSGIYSLQYPDNVRHLILADPWGIPLRPPNADSNAGWKWKLVLGFMTHFNPLAAVRIAGPYGPGLIEKVRGDIAEKFENVVRDTSVVNQYIYHLNAQNPTGENAFSVLTIPFGWATSPLCDRLTLLNEHIPVTFMYGNQTWMNPSAGRELQQQLGRRATFHVIPDAGHHIYIDNVDYFNDLVLRESRAVLAQPHVARQGATIVPPTKQKSKSSRKMSKNKRETTVDGDLTNNNNSTNSKEETKVLT